MTEIVVESRRAMHRLNLIGITLIFLLVGGGGVWGTLTPISGAVIAPGVLVVESKVKKIQHVSGGIVGEVLVKEGDLVREGQLLMRLDDTVTRATLGVYEAQFDEMTARRARLRAERDQVDQISFPQDLLDRIGENSVADATNGERTLFASRRNGREGQKAQLRQRISQTKEEIAGISAQIAAKEKEINLTNDELSAAEELFEKNLVTMARVKDLQRTEAQIEGERGQLIAQRAQAEAKNSETELQILQLDEDFRTGVMKDLRDAEGQIAELEQHIIAAKDQLGRMDIRAPQSGYVNQLAVHTIGGVISAGETIMEIVPVSDGLVVEAEVQPTDVDQLAAGAPVAVRILAGNRRTTPEISGTLSYISADLTQDQRTGRSYYLVRAKLPPDEIARLGDLKLVPGMPAELLVHTEDRTPLQYLVKPLKEQVARAFRER